MYCKEILLILFKTYEKRGQYEKCIAFMSQVEERQPLVRPTLGPDDYATLLRDQSSAIFKSQTIMYEVVLLNDAEEPDEDVDEFF